MYRFINKHNMVVVHEILRMAGELFSTLGYDSWKEMVIKLREQHMDLLLGFIIIGGSFRTYY